MPDSPSTPPEETPPSSDAFQALYRRYRPQTFAELRGQEHVGRALRNAVRHGRVAHAYLFSGPRGTGKTSSARILAKALNCADPVDGEPCGVCDSCRSIAAGTSFDVHELDAASSNGVDAMRDLVGRAALATPGRWKVYIVDEVHMLSTAASNALLKTLEEPPAHVVFVLATTEPQKVLPTIRSRTQHYEFHLLSDEVIDELLTDVAGRAGLDLPDGAIDLVTRRARGSARDALSALDQVAAAGVLDDDTDALSGVVVAISAHDAASALAALDDAVHAGRDPEQVAVELVERLRSGFLELVSPGRAAGRQAGHPGAAAERAEAEALGLARCVRTMELLGAALVAMRDAPDPRITLELALIRCTHPQADESQAALLQRLEQLERRVEELGAAPAPPPPSSSTPSSRSTPTSSSVPVPPTASERAARPALGSFRRKEPAADPDAGPPPAAGASAGSGAPGAPVADSAPANATPTAAAPSLTTAPSRPTGPPPAAGGPPPAGSSPTASSGPSRDDLVAAWGDSVLPRLSLKFARLLRRGSLRRCAGGCGGPHRRDLRGAQRRPRRQG